MHKANHTCDEVGRDPVCEKVHHKNSAGDKENPSLCVHTIALAARDLVGDNPREMTDPLCAQLLDKVLLKRQTFLHDRDPLRDNFQGWFGEDFRFQ